LTGWDAVNPTDADHSGVPDYVETVTAVLDSVWRFEVDQLGYQPPPSDLGAGGGDEYDVYVVQLGQGSVYYGLTYPDQSGPVTSSFIEIDNDYLDPAYINTRGLSALRVTLAHEFFHAIQFGYYQGADGSWWQEATATWMEEMAYPEVDDYLYYLTAFLSHPERALDSGTGLSRDIFTYGACLFPHLLSQRWHPDLVRQVWAEFGVQQSANLDLLDAILRRTLTRGLDEAMGEFAVWNYYTGSRYRDGYYREGERYPLVRVRDLQVASGGTTSDSGWVDHAGTAYLRLEPQLRGGGVVLGLSLPRGQWESQVLANAPDAVTRQRPTAKLFRLAGWDRYAEVVVALTNQEHSGSAYPYTVTVNHDSGLVDQPAPVVASLAPNYPNPFHPDRQEQTLICFQLAQACPSATLSLYAVDGRLVRRFDLGPRAARAGEVAWDGRDQHGALVASGVYFYVLEAGAFRAAKPSAVVRTSEKEVR
jgi:hypothetical protein